MHGKNDIRCDFLFYTEYLFANEMGSLNDAQCNLIPLSINNSLNKTINFIIKQQSCNKNMYGHAITSQQHFLLARHSRRREGHFFTFIYLQIQGLARGWLDTAATFRGTLDVKKGTDAIRQVVVLERQRCHTLKAEELVGLAATNLRLNKTIFTNNARKLTALALVFICGTAATQTVGANGQATTSAQAEAIAVRLAATDEVLKVTGRVTANTGIGHTVAGTIVVLTHLSQSTV